MNLEKLPVRPGLKRTRGPLGYQSSLISWCARALQRAISARMAMTAGVARIKAHPSYKSSVRFFKVKLRNRNLATSWNCSRWSTGWCLSLILRTNKFPRYKALWPSLSSSLPLLIDRWVVSPVLLLRFNWSNRMSYFIMPWLVIIKSFCQLCNIEKISTYG